MKNYFDLSGKTAIVTGASSGLGEQFAKALNKAGARVILAARRFDKIKKLEAELINSKAIEVDISNKESVKKFFTEIEKGSEKIDICINNAAIAAYTPIFEDDVDDKFDSIIKTNLIGTWYVLKAVAKHMKSNNIAGSIINIGSINGDAVPAKGAAAYSASKAALKHISKNLVGELSPYKIRVNCIAPGLFRTPMNGHDVDEAIRKIPFGKIAEPSDLDALILYLSSNEASWYVTGSCITIDGGVSWGGSES